MPLDNLAKKHFTVAEKQQLDDAIKTILNIINQHAYPLNAKERSKYGKVGDNSRLFIDKVRDINNSQPNLSSPDVDWTEFEADYQTRLYASGKISQLNSALTGFLTMRILHDHDNLNDALKDYRYSGYKSRFTNHIGAGHSTKAAALKQFFPKTGKKKKKE